MRSIARRFTAEQFQADSTEQLRLLPQPIYRYQADCNTCLDGALFAFLRETDLETVLIIEASKENDSPSEWAFDCMPVSVQRQIVRLDDNVVWEHEQIGFTNAQQPEENYFIFTRPASPEEVGAERKN